MLGAASLCPGTARALLGCRDKFGVLGRATSKGTFRHYQSGPWVSSARAASCQASAQ